MRDLNNIFNEDFKDFIHALNACDVEYILVGGYSVILHGYFRTTGDMDVWVNPTPENYNRLLEGFKKFGMPVFDMTLAKFLNTKDYDVFIFGNSPVSIEVLTKVKGLEFEQALEQSEFFEINDTLKVRALRLSDLLKAKESAGRPKDLDDIDQLKRD